MMKSTAIILKGIFALSLLCCQALMAQTQKIELNSGWDFREQSGNAANTEWLTATVPGLIHTDLLAHKLIPDPFYRDNEAKVQWVEKKDWEYHKTIQADAALLSHRHIDLVFEGLNTLADVYLNDQPILKADNMFREWRVDLKPFLKSGSNSLTVVFRQLKPEVRRLQNAHPEEMEGLDTTNFIAKSLIAKMIQGSYVRKAAYEGGWDWGPSLITCGIWRPVYLETWDKERILSLGILQPDITPSSAHINVSVQILSAVSTPAVLKISYGTGGQNQSVNYPVTLHPGKNDISYPIDIPSPKLWYPNGYGPQNRYRFTATLTAGGVLADRAATESGLRSVKLNTAHDSLGRKFEFIVNGIPVFAKGANLIPFDHFPTRVTTARYKSYLQAAADAHMNMLRVWGGGYYETEEFYNLCDELGIMIWQDFMFANATPPAFLRDNISKEVAYQVTRLRNHPCIAVWSGNNEISMSVEPAVGLIPDMFKSMMEKLPPKPIKTYTDYTTTFYGLVPAIVKELSPELPYTASSPTADFEKQNADYTSGDRHNYEVWWNAKPIEDQANYKDRFVSETGIQGFPDLRTINAFTLPEDRSATSVVMNAHQKNFIVNGNKVIGKIIETEYKASENFETLDYLSQLVQAQSLKIYSEAMRRRRPFSMGFLYWQLNDTWPVISWATMDSYARPKAAMYYAKRFFSPVLVSPVAENGKVNIYVISDETTKIPASLTVKLTDFSGKVLLSKSMSYTALRLSSGVAASWTDAELKAAGYDESKTFVSAVLKDANGNVLSSGNLYFKKPKDLELQKAVIKTDLQKQADHYVLTLTSASLAPTVGVSFGENDTDLSDNFFDLLPNEQKSIIIKTPAGLETLKISLKLQTIN